MTRLSAERFNMQQRIKEGQRARERFAVMVISAKCRHIVDVQLTGDGAVNQALVNQAQAAVCTACRTPVQP